MKSLYLGACLVSVLMAGALEIKADQPFNKSSGLLPVSVISSLGQNTTSSQKKASSLSLEELFHKLAQDQKVANKQLGFLSGKAFSRLKAGRKLTGSQCQNSYIEVRNSFNKIKKKYKLLNMVGRLEIPQDQLDAHMQLIAHCQNACGDPAEKSKTQKYSNYKAVCEVQKDILTQVQAQMQKQMQGQERQQGRRARFKELQEKLHNLLEPLYAHMLNLEGGTAAALTEIKGTSYTLTPEMEKDMAESLPAVQQCLADYEKMEARRTTTDIEQLKGSTIACLDACNPRLLVETGFSQMKEEKIKLESALKGAGQDKKELEQKLSILKKKIDFYILRREKIQAMNRGCLLMFQSYSLGALMEKYPRISNESLLNAAARLELIHDGKVYILDVGKGADYNYYKAYPINTHDVPEGKKASHKLTHQETKVNLMKEQLGLPVTA